MTTGRCEVAVVGGGPVGLLLGSRLALSGIDVRVIERERVRRPETRAIGVHPPGLACLDAIGVADELVSRGVRVRRGLAFAGQEPLGVISFGALPPPFDFVLSVPQRDTEDVLERRLAQVSPGALTRGEELTAVSPAPGGLCLRLRSPTGDHAIAAGYLLGCDGRHSAVRRAMHVDYQGGPYPARFIMGDAPDDTGYGPDAAVFLTATGLIESFPLPQGRRRWVAGTGPRRVAPEAHTLRALVAHRTGHSLRAAEVLPISTFTAEHYLANRFAQDRMALAGDAAHMVSPIGGQGMNLGWLDAWALAECLREILRHGSDRRLVFARYERDRRRAAKSAIRRAELFMTLGGAFAWHAPRDACVRALLSPWLAPTAARLFTMRGLARSKPV